MNNKINIFYNIKNHEKQFWNRLNIKKTYSDLSLSEEGFEELIDNFADIFNACKAEQGSGFLLSKGD